MSRKQGTVTTVEMSCRADEVKVDDALSWAGRWVVVVDRKPAPQKHGGQRPGVKLVAVVAEGDERELHYWSDEVVAVRRAFDAN